MPILNYTTQVAVERTVQQIQKILVKAGAESITVNYDEKQEAVSLFFTVTVYGRSVPFRLPTNWQGVLVVMREAVMTSPALFDQSDVYPKRYNGRVPRRVRMRCTVCPDDAGTVIGQDGRYAVADAAYEVWVNAHGAVSVIFDNGQLLGVKSDEFEVIEWHEENDDG